LTWVHRGQLRKDPSHW